MSSFYIKNFLRVVEKVPGINLLQVAHFGEANVLMFPKVGTRSIRNSVLAYKEMGDDRLQAWHSMSYVTKGEFLSDFNKPETLVTLRDPLERLHSCWKQKISEQRDKGFFYFFQYYPLLRPDMDFFSFLKAISRLPPCLYEKHFIPLDHFLGGDQPLNYRFIALPELDLCLAEILGSDKPVPRANVTKRSVVPDDARAFFEAHLANRYAFDIQMLEKVAQ